MNGLQWLITALFLAALATVSASTRAEAGLAERANQVLEQRCMVCHGCYDAPCQLKLESREGLMRGASKDLVYDASRLVEAKPTRLFDDAQSVEEWREMGFYPVIDSLRPGKSVLRRLLEQKRQHPLPKGKALPEGFDFALDRKAQCPKPDEFSSYKANYPLWGMPYGLPGLNEEEHAIMLRWLDQGAPPPRLPELDSTVARQLSDWETFINGSSPKQRLMSRYLYEHLFLAALYFEDSDGQPNWYRMVRSKTPPGESLAVLATRRPYDHPGQEQFYYRLQAMPATPLRKTHMPYRLDADRMAWYRELFLTDSYQVNVLPGYDDSNPFAVFHEIPVGSRYRFLLEEAQFTIMNFIKGPVCRGRVALNVIEDHFWVMFIQPEDAGDSRHEDRMFLAEESRNLRLPQAERGTVLDLLYWNRYSKAQENYQVAKWEYIQEFLNKTGTRLDYDALWYGEGQNDNATLTVFRHFDTASVVKGLVGAVPKTAWVIDYPLLERIHYLLVAGFDVFGAVSHQLESRLYMDFLRMEGEFNFLLFMPADIRRDLHNYWYRGAPESTRDHLFDLSVISDRPTDVEFKTDQPMREFLLTVRERAFGARAERYEYRGHTSAAISDVFRQLESSQGAHYSYLPQVSYVNVIGDNRDEVYTLLRNSGYSNIAQLFLEDERRLPEEDNLTVLRGFVGAYPNHFFQLNEKEVAAFGREVQAMKSEKDFARLVERYGVKRSSPWFWRLSDKFHAMLREQQPVAWGLLDYGRYQGYYRP